MNKLLNKIALMATLASVAVVTAVPAHAVIDITAAETNLGDGTVAIAAVGTLIIGLASLSMIYRWVKATFF
jgi:hypothetical protein